MWSATGCRRLTKVEKKKDRNQRKRKERKRNQKGGGEITYTEVDSPTLVEATDKVTATEEVLVFAVEVSVLPFDVTTGFEGVLLVAVVCTGGDEAGVVEVGVVEVGVGVVEGVVEVVLVVGVVEGFVGEEGVGVVVAVQGK